MVDVQVAAASLNRAPTGWWLGGVDVLVRRPRQRFAGVRLAPPGADGVGDTVDSKLLPCIAAPPPCMTDCGPEGARGGGHDERALCPAAKEGGGVVTH